MRQLLELGFAEDDLTGLGPRELRRLASWTVSTYELGFVVVGTAYGVVLGAVVALVRWSTPAELPETMLAFGLCVLLSVVLLGLGGARAAYWLMCLLDRYQSFGDAAASILRWIRPPVTERLARKERCLRLTRRWSVEGRRNGLALSLQEQRIMELLAGELTTTTIEEIHGILRGSLLDAAHGRIDPDTYETAERPTARRMLQLVAEIVGFVALASTVLAPLTVALVHFLRGG